MLPSVLTRITRPAASFFSLIVAEGTLSSGKSAEAQGMGLPPYGLNTGTKTFYNLYFVTVLSNNRL
jgi:hypothetical protein